MSLPNKQKIESFIFNLSIAAGGVVLLFAILNGYSFWIIILRTVLSFSFMFWLGRGFMVLWEKLSPPVPQKANENRQTIDIILGIEDHTLDDKAIPGQINIDMKNVMQDASAQAEIVRRMGWGEE